MIYEQFNLSIKNPIISNHRVYDQALLPGLAYIDIIFQVFKKHSYSYNTLELCNLSIYNPLTVGDDYSVKLSIQCTEAGEGQWQIRIEGQQQREGGLESEKTLYVTAEMHQTAPIVFEETLDLNIMKQSAKKITSLHEVYDQYRSQELVHTGFMKAEGKIYEGETSAIIDISLSKDALPTTEGFMFHPVLIDGSGMGSWGLFSSQVKEEQPLFLPLFYESFRASALLQRHCVTRIQTSSMQRKKEILHLTMEFFDEVGKKVGELKNFTGKLVRDAGLINPNRKETQQPTEDTQSSKPSGSSSSTEVETFLRQLLADRLEKPMEQIDAQAGYYEMGLDSPGLLGIVQAIGTKINTTLSPTLLFEYTTIAELSAYLTENYASKFGQSDAVTQEPLINEVTFESQPIEDDIAIIGMAGRYPKARNLQEFWANLQEGKDCISEIPESRWDYQRLKGIKSPSGKSMSKWGGFIDDPDCFDSKFFRISPREAETIDPQERLFLETCWEAIEDAGYTPKTLAMPRGMNKRRHVGVFVGVMHKDYALLGADAVSQGQAFPLSMNHGPIANRVSYFCNFNGPSMAVDTLCSSSLTAVHLALESIKRGECEVALAGGVNLSLHPGKYITYGMWDMHSSDGRCRTFGEGGDGYVSAEGVGAVLLKPLHKAVEDGDNIYAVIKGSTINHVGTVSGVTVPSPIAQADMIVACLEKTGIDPRTISYIEAHGTGTSLGDPIEIQGLVKAFTQFTQEQQFCSIGSVKSNIGHAESAAGVIGLHKVALQLYNKTLVPSLHSEELNPYIDFEQSPFYVQHKTEEWKQPINSPRRAGLSSFGATGSNAHIILEEYIPKETQSTVNVVGKPVIVPLSAKNKERLHAYAKKLLDYLRRVPEVNLVDLAYTLQLGREEMEERVGFVVEDVPELIQKLEGFLQNKDGIDKYYQGQVKSYKNATLLLAGDEDSGEFIHKLITKGMIEKLVELWVKGVEMNWHLFYEETKPHRISLPTYPFAKERYWIPVINTKTANTATASVASIHPLLHQNTSDLSEQRFSSTFTGQEFFLSDHVVKGQRVLPGVTYLEMARAAVDLATGGLKEEQTGIRLKNVAWIRPITVGEKPVRINIGLFPQDNGEIAYEIYSNSETAEPIVHSQGNAVLNSVAKAPALDIRALQAQCTQNTISSTQFYEIFRAMGIDYGRGHQGVEKVYVGEGQVLAKLSLPSSVSDTKEQFVLHPSLMDSALQASIGLTMSSDDIPLKPILPFALQELEIFSNLTPAMWALIRYSDKNIVGNKAQKLDVDLCDEQGSICVRMKGFSTRVLEGDIQTSNVSKAVTSETSIEPPVGNIMLLPVWDVTPLEKTQNLPTSVDKVLIVGGNEDNRSAVQQLYPNASVLEIESRDNIDEIEKKLRAYGGAIDHIVWIAPHSSLKSLAEDALIKEQNEGVLQCVRTIKALLRLGYSTKNLGWTVITTKTQPISKNDVVNPTHASLHGLVGSMAKEYPNWKIRLVDIEGDCDCPVEDIFTLPTDRRGRAWVYRNGEWYRQQLIPFECSPTAQTLYKTRGVYVVIGGAGGIGEAWSEYMIRTYQAQIIWIGRRQKDESIQTKLDRLAKLGSAPHYIVADASNLNELQQAYETIKKQYSHIHGVIHSAMVLSDISLENMKEEQFKAGLSAKVDVSVRMAQVFGKEPLDFVLFFSSLIAFIKNPKQSHYASGCTFKDAFAHQLSKTWSCTVKVMNWGYWSSAEATASEDVQQLAQIGLGLIEPEDGMRALETLLTRPINQVALIKTTKPLVVEGMNVKELVTAHTESIPSNIQSIEKHIPQQGLQIQRLKSEMIGRKEMHDLFVKLLWTQLQSIGLFREKNLAIENLKTKFGLRDLYGRWLEESIAVLARNNYLRYDGGGCTVVDTTPVDIDAVWKEWDGKKGAWLENPNTKAQVVLVEATLRALPEILTGKRLATDIMFPNSSMKLVEGVYKNNNVADYFNEVLADSLVTYIEERIKQDSSAQIRILEIGAGTGGTSAMVFQKLKPYQAHIEEYCYTDISKAFLMHAEDEFGPENPYLTYKIFNAEAPIAGQNISAGGYDVAIATNVLHATKNIRQTLRNTKAILKKNGLVLLNEMSDNGLFTHLTFGLLEGWWLHEDTAIRIPGCPGLYPQVWQEVLECEGFRSVFFPAQKAHDLGQQIIVGQSDGVVRQQLKPSAVSADEKAKTKHTRNKAPQPSTAPKTKVIQTSVDVSDQMVEGHVKETIIEKLSEALKVDINMIDVDEAFADYGLDSIIGVHLVQVINQALMIELDTTSLFDYSSVNQLTTYILSEYKDTIAKALGQNVKQVEVTYESQDLTPENKEETPAYSQPKRFLGGRALAKPDVEHQEEGSGKSIQQDDIAIIGMSGRYAKSSTVNELWKHLSGGTELIEKVSRWELSKYYPKEMKYCNNGGFVDDIDKFDPLFFNISGLEASYMDPQQRIFLEEAWKALEDAGYAGAGIQGRPCGVYVGCLGGTGDYNQLFGENAPPQAFWGAAGSVIPARVSYYLDLQGPAIAIDTACSSSLVAIHIACQALWNKETELALCGGVFIQSTEWFYLSSIRAGMLSPTGHSYTFDERADGFVPGEGVGIVVLKRLKEAIADGDHIYGVIKGTGLNQDGTTNGITAPSANSQERLEYQVYDSFNIHPEQIQMVEAHGTGTKLGDPIEYQALTRAFRKYTNKKEYCAIGSIKTNIGHAAHAAGVAGVIKILLSLKHKKIPPTLNFEAGNPNIQFEESPFYVNTSLRDWEIEPNAKRCAAVSSFGFSGTNAHIVIEEAPNIERQHIEKPGYLIVLSARTSEQLRQQVEQLVEYCEQESQIDCGNMSYTLVLGRKHFSHRLACVVRNQNELATLLKKWVEKRKVSQIYLSELHENDHREQPSLKRYGNQCIQSCQYTNNASEYLEHLSTIAELYVQGYALEFEQLFSNDQYCRVSLPTYPFAREHYWVPENKTKHVSSSTVVIPTSRVIPSTSTGFARTLLQPYWREQAIAQGAVAPAYTQHLVMLCDIGSIQMDGVKCITMKSEQVEIDKRFQDYASRVFEEIQSILKQKPSGKVLIQIVTTNQDEQQVFSGLSAMLKTAQLENSNLIGQVIEVEGIEELIEKLKENSRSPVDNHIRYDKGKRWVAGLREAVASGEARIPWKDNGIYLITGGVGGLGLIFAKEIASKVKGATLILTGRSSPGTDKQARLKELQDMGARVEYKQVDVSDKEAVASLIQSIHGLNGIIHSAGVIRDSFIIKKTKEELQAVLAPKVSGVVNLDEASKDLNIDFLILFSSISGTMGNAGQADYSTANAFMDAYAKYRNSLVASKQRKGQTLSINWPLWKDGGMQVDAETERMLAQSMGMAAMQTSTGIWALYQGFASGVSQLMVIEGEPLKIKKLLNIGNKSYSHTTKESISQVEPGTLKEKTTHQVKALFGEVTSLSAAKIDIKEPLESYGIDSIMINQLNQKFGDVFGELSKTLFYEYHTLGALIEYFVTEFPQKCMQWTGLGEQAEIMHEVSLIESELEDTFPMPASLEIEKPQTRNFVTELSKDTREPIAIIGMSGRYAQAKNLKEYWENLKAGKDCITEIPKERWSLEGFFHPDQQEAVAQGKSYSKWGSFLEGFADFDPLFFNISPREAMNMDPQERIFIESCWEVIEDAAYTREQLATQYNRRIGVFAGITKRGYDLYTSGLCKQGEKFNPYTSFSSVANRISYLLNLQGPSMPIDTMCSSSLTAIHEACEHIHIGECEMAIAGGVNLYLHPSNYLFLCTQQMLSKDGKCKSFGEGANGFVPGEGVGVVLLKRLSKAIEDGDNIYAVIRGTSINHGGKTNGYTVPNPVAQGEVIRAALDKAGVNARAVSYIEAHGTGTELGDPIEITGLTQAFHKDTQDTGFCAIGSAKSNIGHLEAAAGIAGLSKIVLQMKHKMLAPSLHAKELNPNINFAKTPFVVQQELTEWKKPVVNINGETKEYPRLAGVSSFGAGGANAHIVIEEYIPEDWKQPHMGISAQNPAIIVLSAKSEQQLRTQAEQLLAAIQDLQFSDTDLADAAYTLQVGREAMEERLAIIVGSVKELEEKLKSFTGGKDSIADLYRGQVKPNKETLAVLMADEEMQETIGKWIQHRKYGKILDLWVRGLSFDWNRLYDNSKPRRISLPTYPFARERYFIPESGIKLASTTRRMVYVRKKEVEISESVLPSKTEETYEVIQKQVPSGKGRRAEMKGLRIEQCIEWDLKEHISNLLKISRDKLDAEENLAEFGFDSIGLMQLAASLTNHYDIEITPAVFFGHSTIEKLVEYFIKEHQTAIQEFYREGVAEQIIIQSPIAAPAPKPQALRKSRFAGRGISQTASEPIAIIGMSGRFPEARNIDEMWNILVEGKDAVKEIPADRFDWHQYYGNEPGKINSKWCGCIPGVSEFDPLFFEISPKEAEIMDPRQRLLLQESWKALEDAGYGAGKIRRSKIGMFVGVEDGDYQLLVKEKGTITSSHNAVLAARLSYFLNLSGPNMAINTACSSGLVAAHQACSSLRNHECDTAIAAGVNLLLTPAFYIAMSQAGMLSQDGKCFAFDKRANGLVPGEAVAVVVLKRLSQAEADGDPIYAVIKGSGVNYDGKTNGITAPSGVAQANLLKSVYEQYKVNPEEIEYIVTHGTGTKLGDPVEINALYDAFKDYTNKQGYCALTSTKTNFGHMFTASGLVSLISMVQALRHETIPASLNCEQENDYINWKQSPFYINKTNKPWTNSNKSRIGAVSAFGMSGTNAHMVLQSYPKEYGNTSQHPPYFLLALSAKTQEALEEKIKDMIATLQNKDLQEQDLLHIGYTLLEGRQHFNHRCAIVVQDREDALYVLKQIGGRERLPNLFEGKVSRDFTGQKVIQQYAQDIIKQIQALQENRNKYQEILYALADFYCQGYELSWSQLYDDIKPRRISVPTYPFARERYWIPESDNKAGSTAKTVRMRIKGLQVNESTVQPSSETKAQEAFEMMTFEEVWQEQALVEASPVNIKTLVCFASNTGNKQAIIDAIQTLDRQTNVIFISQGTTYKKQSSQEYSIVRTDPKTYNETFKSIREDYSDIDSMMYLWALEESDCIQDTSGIVYTLQAIASAKLKPKRFLLAGQYNNELERCYLESWIGFERSLGLVLPNTRVAVVHQGNVQQMKDWVHKLWAELQAEKAESVLYKEGKRHVCRVRPTAIQSGSSLIQSGGTYLITGGCGGLGLLFAEHLAKTQPVNLILTGRSPLDGEKQSKINALEALGSRVMYVQADVCDVTGMKEGLNQAKQRFGGINGVIHAAGISSSQGILGKEIQSFREVLAPKIKGTLVLDELLQGENIDFICYFSSSSAILGDFGSCDYAIGNRFQMAYAHYRNTQQCQGKAVVINWPLWKDGGMGFNDDENTKMYLKSSGQRFLEAEEGLAVFERLLIQNNTQHLVLVGQRSRVYRFLGLNQEQASKPIPTKPTGKGWRAEMKGLRIEQCLEWDLKEIISNLLKISRDKLDAEENFADFGFDSISLAQLATALTNHYDIEITPSLFFGHSTIEKLIQYFLDEHKTAIQEFYQEGVVEQLTTQSPITAVAPKRHVLKKSRFVGGGIPQAIPEPIAIIGMSGRFPEARNIDEMWNILAEGKDAVKEIPADRFDWRQYYGDTDKEPGKTNCKWCGCIPGVSEFDPLFFEISPKEAETMDPRQRLLMQESWKALEDAGYGARRLKASKIGMFVGVEDGDYHLLVKEKGSITSNHNAILAARLSYFLNLSGPNMAINTACSSGLVAAHQAVLSLRSYECDTAIAAGVNLMLTPDAYVGISQAGILSQDGKCFAFDKRANGTVPGEAVAVVVLKRLSQAQADGDPIYAVIRGSGVNYDGKTNGITAPSGVAQTSLLKSVYDQYNVNPEEIEYIVTHGTGTKLGDPIEINALNEAFKDYTKKQGYCALTSTKTNLGHTFAASGLVSLINLVQALRHETIPASLHCEQENDYINWKQSPFYVNKTSKHWSNSNGISRTGAVSAFGMSGTNVHMVLQSYSKKECETSSQRPPYFLLALSAKTQEALEEKIKDIVTTLQNKDLKEQDLLHISYTLSECRQHFNHRCAIVIQDREDALYVLKQFGGKERLPNLFQGRVPRDFTGQKAMQQYVQDLLQQSQSSRENRNKYQETLFGLADLYCQGYEIDWNQLHGDTRPHPIHLPTYPFARERYWVPENKEQIEADSLPLLDDTYYDQLIDEVANDAISIEEAVQKTKSLYLQKINGNGRVS